MASEKSYDLEQRLALLAAWMKPFPMTAYTPGTFLAEVAVASFGPIPANDAGANIGGGANGSYRLHAHGYIGAPASQVYFVNLRLSATPTGVAGPVLGTSTPQTTDSAGSIVSRPWTLDAWFDFASAGAAGVVHSGGRFDEATGNGGAPTQGALKQTHTLGDSAALTVDTTAALYAVFSIAMTNTSPSNNCVAQSGSMERIGWW